MSARPEEGALLNDKLHEERPVYERADMKLQPDWINLPGT